MRIENCHVWPLARLMEDAVSLFRRKRSNDLVPIHPDNSSSKDWAILLEAGTIVGPSPQRIRVARWMQEKKIVKKYDMFLRTKHFIAVEGFNPRIHALYFCPQLYRYDNDKLVPLEGEEIGRLMVQALQDGASDRKPWYEPLDKLPEEPVVTGAVQTELDSVVVSMPPPRTPPASKAKSPA